jgi:putative chitinase
LDKFAFMNMTGLPLKSANIWYPLVIHVMRLNGIIEKQERALFLAVIMAESALFTRTVDNIEYSIAELKNEFYSQLTTYQAEMLGGLENGPARGKSLANLIWAKEYGNTSLQDGWRFRPRGLIPVVGRENYRKLSWAMHCDLISTPELLEQPEYAIMSAGYLWRTMLAGRVTSLSSLCQMFNHRMSTKLVAYQKCYALAAQVMALK